MLSVTICNYAECHYDECRQPECHCLSNNQPNGKILWKIYKSLTKYILQIPIDKGIYIFNWIALANLLFYLRHLAARFEPLISGSVVYCSTPVLPPLPVPFSDPIRHLHVYHESWSKRRSKNDKILTTPDSFFSCTNVIKLFQSVIYKCSQLVSVYPWKDFPA